ncbi:hypothetical protein CEK28_00110 [Xenophilus sp. AP218F]|nr:hypothetical protein [Chromobacterium sp. ASV5]OWY40719.1 hypothetical protein CEK28_00110 [Xenophilus sp. AP218F]
MKKLIAILLACGFSLSVHAARLMPAEAQAGTIDDIDGHSVSFTQQPATLLRGLIGLILPLGQSYRLAPGVRIYDQDNRFLLTGQLPDLAKRNVAVTFDGSGSINRIWVLRDEEIEMLKQRALEATPSTE